jgi:hypothetical protein
VSRQHEGGEVPEVACQRELVTDRIPITGVEWRPTRRASRSALPVGSFVARLAGRYTTERQAAGDRARP